MLTRSFVGGCARHCRLDQGFVSGFIDSTDIEVDGKYFKGAKRNYRGVCQYRCIRFLWGECFQGATDRL